MVDSKFHEYHLKDLTDVPAHSIEREVTVIPPANAQGYTITPNKIPVVVSYLNNTPGLLVFMRIFLLDSQRSS